jgi:hypothetical protein
MLHADYYDKNPYYDGMRNNLSKSIMQNSSTYRSFLLHLANNCGTDILEVGKDENGNYNITHKKIEEYGYLEFMTHPAIIEYYQSLSLDDKKALATEHFSDFYSSYVYNNG